MSRGKKPDSVSWPSEPPTPPGDSLPGTEVVVPEVMRAQQIAPSGSSDAELEVERLSTALLLLDSKFTKARTLLLDWAALHGEPCACKPCLDTRRFLLEGH